MGYDLPKGSI
jgi:hypothetical protein